MAVLSYDDVTACLVTRGDVDMGPVLESLPYARIIVWNNAERSFDMRVAGRYTAALQAFRTPVVYFQDDDVLFSGHAELHSHYEPGRITAVYAHGEDPGGYGDVAMVGAGALVDRSVILPTLARYLDRYPMDDDFLHYCDFAFGTIAPAKQLTIPFEIRDVAYNGRRLADEPWAPAAKARVTERARMLR